MTGRERVLTALDHAEPDRVPYDLASTQVTGIAVRACSALRRHLGLAARAPQVCDIIQQICVPHRDLLDRLRVDTRGLFPLSSHNLPLPEGGEQWRETHRDVGENWEYRDEWGFVHHYPKKDGLYYTLVENSLPGMDVSTADVDAVPMPDGGEAWRVAGLREQALRFREEGRAVVVKSLCAGLVEMAERVRGMENFLVDLLVAPEAADRLMERLLEVKLRFWQCCLTELGDVVDVVMEADDYGTQESQLVSPEIFRTLVKPKLKRLFDHIRSLAPEARIFFHSCGSVRPIIPDFIEIGIDVLNPVHITAAGMEPHALKRDFGADICFWGGGVETQSVLPTGTPEQVRDDVRRNIEALAPGGGWVFNTVHNIQADVPPENVMAMWETLQEYGVYGP
jgi:uroporphyrinogen decarboxylase